MIKKCNSIFFISQMFSLILFEYKKKKRLNITLISNIIFFLSQRFICNLIYYEKCNNCNRITFKGQLHILSGTKLFYMFKTYQHYNIYIGV